MWNAVTRPGNDVSPYLKSVTHSWFKWEKFDVVGPVCESGDFFARNREMPAAAEGDLLAILDAGAYGMSLASNYNTRARAAEVLIDGKAKKVIRNRESVGDLLAPELV